MPALLVILMWFAMPCISRLSRLCPTSFESFYLRLLPARTRLLLPHGKVRLEQLRCNENVSSKKLWAAQDMPKQGQMTTHEGNACLSGSPDKAVGSGRIASDANFPILRETNH